MGIWHIDHFDYWGGSCKGFKDDIINGPKIEYNGIEFSSLMYKFNSGSESLFHFINTHPVQLNVNGAIFHLPAYLEIILNQHSNGALAYTLEEIFYFGIKFIGLLQLSEEGIMEGCSSESMTVEVYGHPEIQTLEISKGTRLKVSNQGQVEVLLPHLQHIEVVLPNRQKLVNRTALGYKYFEIKKINFT
jgi:hypothetical protein